MADFNSLSISAQAADVTINIGGPTTLKVTADDNIVPVVTSVVSGNTLTVGLTKQITTKLGVNVEITTPSLVAVSAARAAKVHLVGVKGSSLTLRGTLGSQVTAGGVVDQLSVSVIGASRADLRQLRATYAVVSLSGTSTAEVNAVRSVTGEASMISHLGVWGESPAVDVKTSGGSSVTRMGPISMIPEET